MLNINPKVDRVSSSEVASILNRHTQNKCGVLIDLDRVLEYITYYLEVYSVIYKILTSKGWPSSVSVTSTSARLKYFLETLRIPKVFLISDERATNYTTSAPIRNSIIENKQIDEEVRSIVELLNYAIDAMTRVSTLKAYQSFGISRTRDWKGNRVVVARPTWYQLSTHRFQSVEPNMQGLPRELKDIFTHYDNQILLDSDSSQIEPRIQWSYFTRDELIIDLINHYEDAYYGLYHYAFMDKEDIRTKTIRKIEIDKRDRDELKTIVLASAYGATEENKFPGSIIYPRVKQRIQNHPKVLERTREIQRMVAAGIESIETPFGDIITPEETTKYKRDSPGWKSHLERCFINNPIQGTASGFMKNSVKVTDRMMREAARGADDAWSAISGYIHDSGKFYINRRHTTLLDEVKGNLAYQVEGWIPIPAEISIGQSEPHVDFNKIPERVLELRDSLQ